MRLATWNVNGIKTVLHYHPWYNLKTYEAMLGELQCDILCIQETKITPAQLTKEMAAMQHYDSFFSFYRKTPVRGIHGTAIFTRVPEFQPLRADEGLSDTFHLAQNDLIEPYAAPSLSLSVDDLREIDQEGRTTVCDFGFFVLINVYAPNITNEERLVFKNKFHRALHARISALIADGRQVMLVGDLNAYMYDIDIAQGLQEEKEKEIAARKGERGQASPSSDSDTENDSLFDYELARKLLRSSVESGELIDITRQYHPDREGMFTCWNTKIDARPSNFGSRIDYILVTPGLRPWIKDSDISPSVYGSDHCPVYAEFHDEIVDSEGKRLSLKDQFKHPKKRSPFTASELYDQFSHKQKSLQSFFQPAPAAKREREASADPPESSQGSKSSEAKSNLNPSGLTAREARHRKPSDDTVSDFADETWSKVFAKRETPVCWVHREPAKHLFVTKSGPNKGRPFYICSRPTGPSLGGEHRCDFFQWADKPRGKKPKLDK